MTKNDPKRIPCHDAPECYLDGEVGPGSAHYPFCFGAKWKNAHDATGNILDEKMAGMIHVVPSHYKSLEDRHKTEADVTYFWRNGMSRKYTATKHSLKLV